MFTRKFLYNTFLYMRTSMASKWIDPATDVITETYVFPPHRVYGLCWLETIIVIFFKYGFISRNAQYIDLNTRTIESIVTYLRLITVYSKIYNVYFKLTSSKNFWKRFYIWSVVTFIWRAWLDFVYISWDDGSTVKW